MKLHVNRTCFHAGLKSQTGMSSFRLSCERTLNESLSDCLTGLNPSFLSESFPWPTRKGKYPVLSLTNVTNYTKISYSIVSLVFRKFSYLTYRNGLNRRYLVAEASPVPQKARAVLVLYLLLRICILVYSCAGCGTSKIY